MRTILFSIGAAVAAMAASATPAAAQWGQPYGYGNYGYQQQHHRYQSTNPRLRAAEWQLQRAVQSGRIDRREAAFLYRELNDLKRLDYRLRYDGRSYRDLAVLDRRADRLERRIGIAMRDAHWDDRRWNDDRGYYGDRRW